MRLLMRRIFYKYQHTAFHLVFEELLVDWSPDLVVCNDWQTLSLGATLKEKNGAKLIYDSHELETHRNPPLPKARKKWMENYERKHLKSCDLITTVCEPIADYLQQNYGVKKPLVITNAPHKETKPLSEVFERWGRLPEKSTLRNECGFGPDDLVLVIVGNATVNRGIETAIKAISTLPHDVKLAVLGNVVPKFKESLDQLVRECDVESRIKFVEPVHPTAVVNFLRTANVGLIPLIPATLSYDFALPNKFFECAFANLPIIASDTIEIKRMIVKYSLGHTFSAGDSKDLACVLTDFRQKWLNNELLETDNTAFIDEFCFEQSEQTLLKTMDRLL